MEFNAARRELQELSLFVWLVMTCSARITAHARMMRRRLLYAHNAATVTRYPQVGRLISTRVWQAESVQVSLRSLPLW